MPGKKGARSPDKKEIAKMVVLHELGVSDRAIGERMGRNHTTVRKYYLESQVYTDPNIKELVGKIRDKELEDLYLLGARGREHLHKLLDKEDAQMIPTIALVDRTFQQRRLLEGKSTANVASLSAIIEAATGKARSPKGGNGKPPIDVTPS